jgi:hypothetical protein
MLWFIKRLRAMESKEILWRAKTAVQIPFEWLEYRQHARRNTNGLTELSIPLVSDYPIRAHRAGRPIESIDIFDLKFDLSTTFDWHKDYQSHRVAPRTFCRAIRIRDTRQVGDIKYIWELNRHQYLSALAYCADKGELYNYINCSLESWIRENPPLLGVNWTSSLELALRVISWAFIYPAIRNEPSFSPDRRRRFHVAVFEHLREISRNVSMYSSANNHLIGEAAGLYVGATCFPLWENSNIWRKQAKSILEREILLQVSSDGINREQATSYHLFTLELFLLAMIIGENANDPFGEAFKSRLFAMLTYLSSISTDAGDLPWFGDSDDARGFLVSPHESSLRVAMELGGVLFREPGFLRFSGDLPTCASQALLGSEHLTQFHSGRENLPERRVKSIFKEGGVATLRSENGDLILVVDFGELGYTSIAAHGHADALSIQLAVSGEYLLVDSGTFAYHSHEKWRTFFRGTSAHNTIRIDYQDQSVMGGRFLWTSHAKTRLRRYEERQGHFTIEAEHDGYTRLPDPVIHRRQIAFDTTKSEIVIRDTLECFGQHNVELFFHFHQEAQLRLVSDAVVEAIFRGRQISFDLETDDFAVQVVKGSDDPILGWRSTAFNRKQAISTLRVFGPIRGTTTIRTVINVSENR